VPATSEGAADPPTTTALGCGAKNECDGQNTYGRGP
jgi:hypothetical protein